MSDAEFKLSGIQILPPPVPVGGGGGGGSGTVTSITAAAPIAVTPDPITGTGTVSHANSGASAGTYGDGTHVAQVTVDAKGHVSSASSVAISATGGHIIQDEGTDLAAQPRLNITGTGVTATNDAGNSRTKVDIPSYVPFVTLTDGANIAVNAGSGAYHNFIVTLAGNRTLDNPTNLVDGQALTILVAQDGTGSRILAYGSKWRFVGGTPTLSTTASKIDVISGVYNAGLDQIISILAKNA